MIVLCKEAIGNTEIEAMIEVRYVGKVPTSVKNSFNLKLKSGLTKSYSSYMNVSGERYTEIINELRKPEHFVDLSDIIFKEDDNNGRR